MSQGNVELVERGYAAFGRRDVPAMVGLLSEDFELDVSGHPDASGMTK